VFAARDLEAVLYDEYEHDDRAVALAVGLALYAPDGRYPSVGASELRALITGLLGQLSREG
jgi:hypothetical protein